MSAYSFCESSTGIGRWHIRKLSEAGAKYSGGIDTASLCGRVNPYCGGGMGGWDLQVPLDAKALERVDPCPTCAERYREITKGAA